MIDARRMEVFTAAFDKNIELLLQPQAMILYNESYSSFLTHSPVLFFGSGSMKWKSICNYENANFMEVGSIEAGVADLSNQKFYDNNFTELVNSEPLYLKAFQDTR
jgi:tRNA threonylcarbamoyladenosine biosynthesis protein TsaB